MPVLRLIQGAAVGIGAHVYHATTSLIVEVVLRAETNVYSWSLTRACVYRIVGCVLLHFAVLQVFFIGQNIDTCSLHKQLKDSLSENRT